MTGSCENCGTTLTYPPSRRRRFCSVDCYRTSIGRPLRQDNESTFWSLVGLVRLPPSGCWLWQGRFDRDGYGVFDAFEEGEDGKRFWRPVGAHVFAWQQMRGPVPNGLLLRHFVCATKACVLPDHLMPGTKQENALDASRDREASGVSLASRQFINRAQLEAVRLLLAKGLSQHRVAAETGVGRDTVLRIANDRPIRLVS